MPFAVISVIAYIYLGLTEKSRRKMGSDWEKQWLEYYSNPQMHGKRNDVWSPMDIHNCSVLSRRI